MRQSARTACAALAVVAGCVLGAGPARGADGADLADLANLIMGPPVIDVRAFGAVGDGVHDDTDALRAAFAAVPAGGGTVLVPPGTYLVDPRGGARAMNVVGSYTAVIGASGRDDDERTAGAPRPLASGATLKLADGVYAVHDGGMLLRNRDAVRGNAGIVIRGLGFDGNDRGNLGRRGRAESLVRCTRCRDLVIEGCRFVDAKYHGIATILGSNLTVRRNRFFRISQTETAGDAVQLNGPDGAVVSDNVVENSDEGLFCQHENDPATPARDCVITDNRLLNLPAAGACRAAGAPFACCTGRETGRTTCTAADPSGCLCAAGASTGSGIGVLAFGARVSGNVLVRVGQLSVQGLRAAGGFPTRDVVIAQNRLLDLAWNTGLTGSGGIAIVATDAPVERVTVRDNRVDHTRDAGIRLAAASGTLSRVDVDHNFVSRSCTAHRPCGGIHLETATSGISAVTIARNAVAGSRTTALRLEGSSDVQLVDNTLDDGVAGALEAKKRRGPVRSRTAP